MDELNRYFNFHLPILPYCFFVLQALERVVYQPSVRNHLAALGEATAEGSGEEHSEPHHKSLHLRSTGECIIFFLTGLWLIFDCFIIQFTESSAVHCAERRACRCGSTGLPGEHLNECFLPSKWFILLFHVFFVVVLQLQLLSVIDNLWILAVERADQAGRELAKVNNNYYFILHLGLYFSI